jgi:hypothetical protein
MSFNTVKEALAACELAGYQPRSHVTGLSEQTYWVHLPGFDRGICISGDTGLLHWANAHWRWLEIEKIRDQAGWEELQEEDSPAGLDGWHAPCGTHEDAWRELGRPMPEEACYVAA